MNFFQGQSSLRGCQKMLSFWPNSQCETIATCWFVKNVQKVLTEENTQLIFCNILPKVIGFFDVLRLKLFPKQLKGINLPSKYIQEGRNCSPFFFFFLRYEFLQDSTVIEKHCIRFRESHVWLVVHFSLKIAF